MAMTERPKESARQEYSLAAFTGNFAVLQDFLAEKENVFWNLLCLLDSFLRGFSQVVLSNNPISGLLIVISLAVAVPGALIFAAATAFLGLFLSLLLRDSEHNVANGLSVFNPLLVGSASFTLIPKVYGAFDSFSILLVILGTIFSVYLARSLGSNKSPGLAWPFNLTEFALLLVLYTQDNGADTTEKLQPIMGMDNAGSDATTGNVSFIGENATNVHIDWGMLFHGTVVSASQVFAVESVITGSIVYLAVLLYSPTTAGFAFLGALIGSLAGLVLGVELNEIYSGFWGFNPFLTGASLGGTFFVLSGQTVAATLVAIVQTTIVQYGLTVLLQNLKLPVISLPFVMVTSLFVKLTHNERDKTFPGPLSVSCPEKQRHDYLANRRMLIDQVHDPEDVEANVKDKKTYVSSVTLQ